MGNGGCGYGQVGKSWGVAPTSCQVGQGAGDSRGAHVKRQHARAIKMNQSFQPCGEADRLGVGTQPASLRDTLLDFRQRNR